MKILAVISSFIFLLVSQSHAGLIAIDYAGTVTDFLQTTPNQIIPLGTQVSGRYVYDSSVAPSLIDANRARFDNALVFHEVRLLGLTFRSDDLGNVFMDNDFPVATITRDSFITDQGFIASPTVSNSFEATNPLFNGWTVAGANMAVTDPVGSVFSQLLLPTSFSLADFSLPNYTLTMRDLVGNGGQQSFRVTLGQLSAAPVPAPSSLVTLLSLVSVGLVSRFIPRKKRF